MVPDGQSLREGHHYTSGIKTIVRVLYGTASENKIGTV